jgi:hypothetical protein
MREQGSKLALSSSVTGALVLLRFIRVRTRIHMPPGFSMGGLVAADAFRQLARGFSKTAADAAHAFWPKIVGVLAYDTPVSFLNRLTPWACYSLLMKRLPRHSTWV